MQLSETTTCNPVAFLTVIAYNAIKEVREMDERVELFFKWLKPDAVDWGDPSSEDYEWPLRDDAPQDVVEAYKSYLDDVVAAREEGVIID